MEISSDILVINPVMGSPPFKKILDRLLVDVMVGMAGK